MALQTSGAISLNQIHIEAGGTTGTQASLNDSDIRGLISATSGSTMSFDDWYGASASTHTITQGTYSASNATYYGFWSDVSTGSIADVPNSSQIGDAYFNNGSIDLEIKMVSRVAASSGFFFYVRMSYSSPVATDAFDSLTLTANGNTITMYTSDAYTSGTYERSWLWNTSFGLTSTEVSDLTTEFDGSGTVDLKFVA